MLRITNARLRSAGFRGRKKPPLDTLVRAYEAARGPGALEFYHTLPHCQDYLCLNFNGGPMKRLLVSVVLIASAACPTFGAEDGCSSARERESLFRVDLCCRWAAEKYRARTAGRC